MNLDDFDPDDPGGDSLFGLPHTADEAAVIVIPVPWDATTSYRQGTASAPTNVLEASGQLDLFDLQTGEAWREGIVMDPVDPQVQAWSEQASAAVAIARNSEGKARDAAAEEADACAEALATWLHARVKELLAAGKTPAVLGGDHSVPLGAITAAAAAVPGLGILHVDAHLDLRVAYEGFTQSHASILYNALQRAPGLGNIAQVGIRDIGRREWATVEQEPRLHLFSDPMLTDELSAGTAWDALVERILAPLPTDVWITLDIDGLDPSLCPTTGTPVPGGLSWAQITTLLAALARSGRRIVGFDLVEVGPGPWDAIVGARLLYKLATWAITTRSAPTT
ncbi:MAG: agmatinase family protein [Myxococcota bacterium]